MAGRLLRITVSAALLGLAIWLLDVEALKDALFRLDPLILVLTTVVLVVEFPVLGLRWIVLVRGVSPLSALQQMRHYLIGVFLNNFTPGQLGADVYRFLKLKDGAEGKAVLAGILVRERLLGLVSYLLFFELCAAWTLAVAPPQGQGRLVLIGLMGLFGAALAGIAVLPLLLRVSRNFWTTKLPEKYHGAIRLAAAALEVPSVGGFVLLLGLSFAGGCVLWTVAVQLVAWDLGSPGTFAMLGMVAVAADLLRLFPLTVQGIGIREGSFAALFGVLGLDPEQGFVVGAVAYALASVALVLSGVLGRMIPDSIDKT